MLSFCYSYRRSVFTPIAHTLFPQLQRLRTSRKEERAALPDYMCRECHASHTHTRTHIFTCTLRTLFEVVCNKEERSALHGCVCHVQTHTFSLAICQLPHTFCPHPVVTPTMQRLCAIKRSVLPCTGACATSATCKHIHFHLQFQLPDTLCSHPAPMMQRLCATRRSVPPCPAMCAMSATPSMQHW